MSQMLNNRYLIVRELGSGGFGDTFLAEDTQIPSRRKCVIKRLKPVTQNPQLSQLIQQRFEREAALLEDLGRHSQIPTLYAYFQENEHFYLVQEMIEGKTLSDKVAQEGLMHENSVRDFLKNILPVLNFVHNKRIVHRDIKPENIIVRYSDGMPVLIDFGAVKESLGTIVNSQGQAANSIVIGTPGFMPSEQAAGRPVFSSDLYSIGLTTIYLLTGKMPYELDVDPRNGEILWRQYAPHLSPALAGVIDRAVQSHAPQRFASAREMLDALQSGSFYQVSPGYDDLPPTYVPPRPSNQTPVPNYTPQPQGYQVPPTVVPAPAPQGYQPPGYVPQNAYQPTPYPVNPSQPYGLVGGGGTFNTNVPVPPEIQGWNWGAFLIPGLWFMSNNVWIGIVSWIPYIGFGMALALGAKGNIWAWRSRQWRSVEQFKAHQRGWAIAGILIWSIVIPMLAIIGSSLDSDSENDTSNTSTTPAATNTSPTPETSTSPVNLQSNSDTKGGGFARVEIGELENYTYKNGLFTINVPQGWQLRDNTDSTELVIDWLDKTENSLIKINMFKSDRTYSASELSNIMTEGLKSIFKVKKDVKIGSPSAIGQGKQKVDFSYSFVDRGNGGKIIGNSIIQQKGNKISLILYILPQEQLARLGSKFDLITESYSFNEKVDF